MEPPHTHYPTGGPETEPAPVQMPVFSELDKEPDPPPSSEPRAEAEPSESVAGNSTDCPSCGVIPRVCPEGHQYYEGMTREECGELVDLWVLTCQGIARAARGSEPKDIDQKLRERFAKVLERQSRHYRPMPAKIEIPMLLVATASTCTAPSVRQREPERQPSGTDAVDPDVESNNGSGGARRARGGVRLDL